MLEPNDRRLLRDALRPPEGFEFDRAISSTFSLDLIALLSMPVAFTFFDWRAQDDGAEDDPLAVMESLRRYAQRIHVFCQAGRITVPRASPILLALIEDVVHEAASPRGGVFHPKVTVLRFTAGTQEVSTPGAPIRYRVLCGSRNLTFDRSWDTLLVLDGELKESRKAAIRRNRPLSEFVATLPSLALRPLDVRSGDDVATVAEELLRVDFELPSGFEDLRFWPIGVCGQNWPFSGRRDRTYIISPFVTDELVGRLAADGSPHYLLSRSESLDALKLPTLGSLAGCFYMNPSADLTIDCPADDSALRPDGVAAPALELTGLHAKVFVADAGHAARLWTGSANATTAAFEQNVEFMVELTSTRKRSGVHTLLPQEAAAKDGDKAICFADLLLPYQRATEVETDPDAQRVEDLLERARAMLAAAEFLAEVRALRGQTDAPAQFSVTLSIQLPGSGRDATTVTVRPVTLRPEAAQPLGVADAQLTFSDLSLEALTPFFVFAVTARSGARSGSISFVLKVPLSGLPADRKRWLLASLLNSRQRVLRYLLMLLADDEFDARRVAQMPWTELGRDGASPPRITMPLLEPLLKTLNRRPHRLEQIHSLVVELSQTEEGAALLPEGLVDLLGALLEARGGVHVG